MVTSSSLDKNRICYNLCLTLACVCVSICVYVCVSVCVCVCVCIHSEISLFCCLFSANMCQEDPGSVCGSLEIRGQMCVCTFVYLEVRVNYYSCFSCSVPTQSYSWEVGRSNSMNKNKCRLGHI